MADAAGKRAAFRALHRDGCFILPNPWDLGSLRRLERLGFSAVASTSAGYAWSLGQNDSDLSRDVVLAHLRGLCAATDLPVNADFEAGFADAPEAVAGNVALAVETGIAALSLEDRTGDRLYDPVLAVERMAAARAAIDAVDPQTMLVGRCEAYLLGTKDLDATIDRLMAYAEAGADCLYAPGLIETSEIKALVRAVAPKPVNVLLASARMRVADLAALGVRRVSTGSRLASAAWAGFEEAARKLRDTGALPAAAFPAA